MFIPINNIDLQNTHGTTSILTFFLIGKANMIYFDMSNSGQATTLRSLSPFFFGIFLQEKVMAVW